MIAKSVPPNWTGTVRVHERSFGDFRVMVSWFGAIRRYQWVVAYGAGRGSYLECGLDGCTKAEDARAEGMACLGRIIASVTPWRSVATDPPPADVPVLAWWSHINAAAVSTSDSWLKYGGHPPLFWMPIPAVPT